MSQVNLKIIDSHTGGEPTRTIVEGFPYLGDGSMAERLVLFREKYDHLRSSLVNEPRGSDVMVGALLCEPVNPDNAAGVIFFNNVGYLGMCGHGTIGLAVTLYHMGKIGLGVHCIETPVGEVIVNLHSPNRASIQNVASYRLAKSVDVEVDGVGTVTGDIAWGGNWFFLVEKHGQKMSLDNVTRLTDYSERVRDALWQQKITGSDGQMIDHVELFGPPTSKDIADSQSFVLCPGSAYDRSPCGTGTSAKLACLIADEKLQPGQIWRQQSIIGSVFQGSVEIKGEQIIPTISGEAFVNLSAEILFDEKDPFRFGIGIS
ncbi:4-hydroxyproline epimerase [Aliikangiella sp. G2MR2-5]|uniref:4-hydroxyproline epimerase n=1 Tax=Aliikangiella sp. G2MR2-5 TaxID=2788943 RepID=UPI0018AC3568|nr:4-hydroxyproline epimerase [Aliikangiella sp. G2MR2-5]